MIRKLIFGLALLLMVGCQNDSLDWLDENRPNPDGSVGFRLKTDDAKAGAGESQTRGTPQNSLAGYATVSVNVFSHTSSYHDQTEGNDVEFFRQIELEQQTPNWKYAPPMFWPVGKKLSFIAYASDIPFDDAGITFSPSLDEPESITYVVPRDVTRQPDLLVSTKFDQEQVNNVSLTMKHALACVSFCGVAPEADTYVKSITLRNVYGKGTLALDESSIQWKDLDDKGITVLEAGIKEDQELGKDPLPDNNYLMTSNGYLMMIPQALKGAAIDVLYWNKESGVETEVITYVLPVDDPSYATWKPGRNYIYKFDKQSPEDITVVYYEKYADDAYGLFYNDKGVTTNTLDDAKEIVEAGYGVMAKKSVGSTASIRITTHTSNPVSSAVVELNGSFLYPVSQSGSTFALPAYSTPVDVYFNNSDKSCGMILPHFAKGIYTVEALITEHAIRTPQQMRNITALGTSGNRGDHTYTQELDLDFLNPAIGGGELTTSVVNCVFNGLYEGQKKKIKNVKINATRDNGALFYSNSGDINEVWLLNSSISSSSNAGGIVATNEASGVILHPRIIGENSTDKKFEVQGTLYTGAVAGFNGGKIIGSKEEEIATELPVAEVSGWVFITGKNQPVGGITGQNQGTITTCLVNGVHVTGPSQGNVEIAKVTIKGGLYVGGIVGVNKSTVDGNYSNWDGKIKAQPDIAGLVSIAGDNFVGGIAGENSGTLNQVNVRLGRGKDASEGTTITGLESVGGIVGFNNKGTLRADGNSNSFISVRGNVHINGTKNVGGIVGNNESGSISNCFVYNFYSQTSPLVHYAPKITGGTNVGGIVGYAGAGTITQCAAFSTVSAANAPGENATNAMVEVKATVSSAGGITGHGFTGLKINRCFVLGNVQVDGGPKNGGGIVGENEATAEITSIHIGNSGTEVANICNNLFLKVGLPVDDYRMKTDAGVMTKSSGVPTIVGATYVGGICGVNWGVIDGVSIKDNVKIGTPLSNFVGGIAGGTGTDATISRCNTYNPTGGTAKVEIVGNVQVGGIVGLNNGIIDQCQLGLPGLNKSDLITINGVSALGGIAGTSGGTSTGNANTRVINCTVYGKVRVEATGNRVGGIIGENGITNRVIDCSVIGYESAYTNSSTYKYDVTLVGSESVGGIAGINYGDIHGTSATVSCKVTHTALVAGGYAGGLVGTLNSSKSSYEALLYYCDVSYGVLILQYNNAAGAFVGNMMGVGATLDSPTLFGTSSGGRTNRIYTGDVHPVRVSGNNDKVKFPPAMESLPYPPDPPAHGNLWTRYQMHNYLYWTEYK